MTPVARGGLRAARAVRAGPARAHVRRPASPGSSTCCARSRTTRSWRGRSRRWPPTTPASRSSASRAARRSRRSPGSGAEVEVLGPVRPWLRRRSRRAAPLLVGGGFGAALLAPLAQRLPGGRAARGLPRRRRGARRRARAVGRARDRAAARQRARPAGARGSRAPPACSPPGPTASCAPSPPPARRAGVPCQVALEAPMACGYGACYGCAVRLGGGSCGSASRARSWPASAWRRRERRSRHARRGARARASGDERVGHARPAGRARRRARRSTRELALVVTKTVTPLAREGNEAPRVCEVAGRHAQLDRPAQSRPRRRSPRRCCRRCARSGGRSSCRSAASSTPTTSWPAAASTAEAGIAALELNVSCPNVKSGCISIGSDPAETEAVVRACRAATRLPLWVKLSPNVADLAAIARAAERGGADALVLTNTLRGARDRPLDARAAARRRHRRALRARRSSPWRWPRSTPAARPAPCRIVGVGGIASGWDALEFLAAGASAVQVGSAAFREPLLARRDPRANSPPYSLSAAWRAFGALKTTTLD